MALATLRTFAGLAKSGCRLVQAKPIAVGLNTFSCRTLHGPSTSALGGWQAAARPAKHSSLLNSAHRAAGPAGHCQLLQPTTSLVQPQRTRVMYSRRTGRPRTVSAVTHRFFRLHNGMWIRTRAGRHKKLWKKSARRISWLRQHVFCNRQQCRLLDKMVNRSWKEKKFYVDDPYEPYHRKWNLPDYKHEKARFYP